MSTETDRTRGIADRGLAAQPPPAVLSAPPDPVAVATRRLIATLEQGGHPNTVARVALSHLGSRDLDLSPVQVRAVLEALRQAGWLGRLLNLFRYPQSSRFQEETLGQFLLRNGVPWSFIFENWEYAWTDSSAFFIGYARGAAEDAVEGLLFVANLLRHTVVDLVAATARQLGAVDERTAAALRAESQAFFAALAEFLDDPLVNLEKEVRRLKDDYDRALLELDFMEAGYHFARITLALLTVPTAARSLWRQIRSGPAALARWAEISYATLRDFFGEAALAEFLAAPLRRLVRDDLVLAEVDGTVYAMSSRGEPVGQIALSELVESQRGRRRAPREPSPSADPVPDEPPPGEPPAGPGRRPAGLSELQQRYADRTAIVYPDTIWRYVAYLEERFPGLRRLRLRPWRRPRIADEWVFEERMRTDQGPFSLAGDLDGMAVQFDGLTPDGAILEIKFRTLEPRQLLDAAADALEQIEGRAASRVPGQFTDMEATIVDQMRRQVAVAEELRLPGGVIWETNSPAFQAVLEQLVTEFGFDRGRVKVYVVLEE